MVRVWSRVWNEPVSEEDKEIEDVKAFEGWVVAAVILQTMSVV